VIAHVLSYDGVNEPDILAMIAASAALTISGVPFMGPIGARPRRLCRWPVHPQPDNDQVMEGDLDLVLAGTQDAVMMVESEAKELSEEIMPGRGRLRARCLQAGSSTRSSARRAGRQGSVGAGPRQRPDPTVKDPGSAGPKLKITSKQSRPPSTPAPSREACERSSGTAQCSRLARSAKKVEAEIVRTAILKEGRRIDGRDTKTVRPIEAMVGFLPRTHGSALFTRGETQAICTTTLGTRDAEQMNRWAGRA
jgi:polyribonucleotide nucleotidyltransferase